MTKKPIDWKKLAEAWQLEIPEADLERIAPRLEALHEIFLPLSEGLQSDQEPAIVFQPNSEES